MSGVPISTLSRVELGQNTLNYDKLIRLCQALDVDVEGLMTCEADAAPAFSGRRSVTRVRAGAPVRVGANGGRAAASDLLSKNFTPIVIDVAATSLEGHGPMVVHPGEAFVQVLSGQVEFHSQLYAALPLGTGESVYFDAAAGYALIAPNGAAQVLLVASGEPRF